jgi:hypothetical protein
MNEIASALLLTRAIRILDSACNKSEDVMTSKFNLTGGIWIASLALSVSLSAQTTPQTASSPSASPKAAGSPVASPAKQSMRPAPFHGMISAVDQGAKTFTLAGKKQSRVFKITDKTFITKAGKPATMTDVTENEEASGSYWKNADGTLEAKMLRLGPTGKAKTPATSPNASPKASREARP